MKKTENWVTVEKRQPRRNKLVSFAEKLGLIRFEDCRYPIYDSNNQDIGGFYLIKGNKLVVNALTALSEMHWFHPTKLVDLMEPSKIKFYKF